MTIYISVAAILFLILLTAIGIDWAREESGSSVLGYPEDLSFVWMPVAVYTVFWPIMIPSTVIFLTCWGFVYLVKATCLKYWENNE
jgi:hypothetical protein